MSVVLLFSATIALTWLFMYRLCFRNTLKKRYPPGPNGLPLIGNIFDLPPKGKPEFQHWLKHKDTYGGISSVTVMGQTLVVIHDKKAALDLLEQKSNRTSSRPQMEFGHKLCGYENLLAVRKYDETYRRQRKLINRQLGTKSDAEPYHDMMEAEAGRFLVRSLEKPKGLMQHLRTATGATILRLTYGYCIQTNEEDPLVDLVERVTRNISDAFLPMAWLIDIIPAVQYLPDGFPGTAFKETARQWNSFSQEVADIPYSFVRNQMKIGSHRPSYISRILEERSSSGTGVSTLSPPEEEAVKWSAATLYYAGSDTTVSALKSFILAMVMFPDVQRKAQEEIDMVTECNSLPRFEDRDKLPYLEAVIKEVYRWSVVVPMGFPHVLEEDMVYNGYFIPKGAYLLPATWWFCHDPEVYTNPAVFNPDRFLKPRDEPDPRAVIFGFGRRKCPGRYIAESSIFITIAQTLAAFRIKNAVDTQGFEIPVELDVTPSLISHPKDFLYDIVPKSPKHEQLIQAINTEHSYEKGDTSLLDKARINKIYYAAGRGMDH